MAAPQPWSLALDGLEIDPSKRDVKVDGSAVELTRMEFELLVLLVSRPGRVFPRSELLETLWGYPRGVHSRTVDVHVSQLRRKLGAACPILTVRGVGYAAVSAEA